MLCMYVHSRKQVYRVHDEYTVDESGHSIACFDSGELREAQKGDRRGQEKQSRCKARLTTAMIRVRLGLLQAFKHELCCSQ